MFHRLFGLLTLLTLAVLPPAPAEAAQAWLVFDQRVNLADGRPGWPEELRIFNQYRVGPDYDWFGQALLRVGPVWYPTSWLGVEAHLTGALDQRGPGVYRQELRAELESTFKAGWGPVSLSDRHRLEHSWFPTETRWRYRNQARVTLSPAGWAFKPFAAVEPFVVVGRGLSENRLFVGASHEYAPQTRADVGYMWRAESDPAGWRSSHVLLVILFFGPTNPPVLGLP